MTPAQWETRLREVHRAASSGDKGPRKALCEELAEMEICLALLKRSMPSPPKLNLDPQLFTTESPPPVEDVPIHHPRPQS